MRQVAVDEELLKDALEHQGVRLVPSTQTQSAIHGQTFVRQHKGDEDSEPVHVAMPGGDGRPAEAVNHAEMGAKR